MMSKILKIHHVLCLMRYTSLNPVDRMLAKSYERDMPIFCNKFILCKKNFFFFCFSVLKIHLLGYILTFRPIPIIRLIEHFI